MPSAVVEATIQFNPIFVIPLSIHSASVVKYVISAYMMPEKTEPYVGFATDSLGLTVHYNNDKQPSKLTANNE